MQFTPTIITFFPNLDFFQTISGAKVNTHHSHISVIIGQDEIEWEDISIGARTRGECEECHRRVGPASDRIDHITHRGGRTLVDTVCHRITITIDDRITIIGNSIHVGVDQIIKSNAQIISITNPVPVPIKLRRRTSLLINHLTEVGVWARFEEISNPIPVSIN